MPTVVKEQKNKNENKLKPSSASAEIFIYWISRQPISAIAERCSTPGRLSQALTVHYYMARGLICTSVLRLTLQSYKKSFVLFLFSFFLFKNQDTRFYPQVIIYKFTFFVCCVAIVSHAAAKMFSPLRRLCAPLNHAVNDVFRQQITTEGV